MLVNNNATSDVHVSGDALEYEAADFSVSKDFLFSHFTVVYAHGQWEEVISLF